MSYQALYRKYRPRRFDEVLGQEHITTILKNQVAASRTAHAYIFSGSRGTGKTSTAKILARAINCLSPENGEPCGKCAACKIMEGECADIVEMDAASNSKVEDMRALLDKARFLPLELSHKVYIIDEAHMLSDSADNALLKTLEEPPAHVTFILATTEPQSIPSTIISRCQRFNFHRIGVEDIVRCVDAAVHGAGAKIDREGLLAIARAADGGMRDALSLADQCISFCGNSVTADDVYSVLGSMEGEFLFNAAETLIAHDRAGALRVLSQVINDGRDLNAFTRDLASHFRALMIAKLCGNCADILDCTEDAMRRYIEQGGKASDAMLLRATDILMEALGNMRYMSLPRVQLECAFVRITSPEEESIQTNGLLAERIDKLEHLMKDAPRQAFADAGPTAGANAPAAPPCAEAEKPKAAAETAGRKTENPGESAAKARQPVQGDAKTLWEALRKLIATKNPTLAVLTMKATRVELDGDVLSVTFPQKNFADAFTKQDALIRPLIESIRPGTRAIYSAGASDTLEERAAKAFGGKIEILD